MSEAEPRITLCMIVRNEEENLSRCLNSVRDVVDEIIVVDTGSTDATVSLAESFGATVLHHSWDDDFSAARNVGLDAATGDWILVLDADEELHQDDKFKLRAICRNPHVEAYSMLHINLIDSGGITDSENSYDVTLWRHRPEYRYRGKLHEQIVTAIWEKNPGARVDYCDEVRIIHYGYLAEQVRAHGKSERNLRIIQRLVDENPGDLFHRFNLGMELQRMRDLEGAVDQFQRVRSGLVDWPLWGAKMFKCLASCLIVLERWDEARDALQHGLAAYPEFTDLVFLLGLVAQKQGQHAYAIGCFHRCIAMGPARDAGGWAGLAGFRAYDAAARSYAALGQVAAAVEAFEAAFAAEPASTASLAGMVEALGGHLPEEEILRRLDRYIDTGTPGGRQVMADVLLWGGRPDLALRLLAEDGENPTSRFLQGLCLLRLSRYDHSEAVLASLHPGEVAAAEGALVAATACYRGKSALPGLIRQRRLGLSAMMDTVRFFLGEIRFWEKVGSDVGAAPPWVGAFKDWREP